MQYKIESIQDLLNILEEKHPEFNYSISTLEEYKKNKKVSFICNKHGVQTKGFYSFLDSKHGCTECAYEKRNEWKMLSKEDFIEKARKVHGNIYLYDKVEDFYKQDEKVTITCPEHGDFKQIISNHLDGCGCVECAKKVRQNTVNKLYGVDNVSQSEGIKQKKIETSRSNWGTDNPLQSEEVKNKTKNIWEEKFGVDNPQKNNCVRMKTINTNLRKYGSITYLQTKEYKELMSERKDEVIEKHKKAHYEKYGMYYSQTEEAKKKQRGFFESKYYKQNIVPEKTRKDYETKKKNGTFCTSKMEDKAKDILEKYFNNVKPQYKSEDYPFSCDFYIGDLDAYIELNYHWTHGSKPFEGTEEDVEILDDWLDKNSRYYKIAANVWADRDVLKRETAERNGLNYYAFYNEEDFNNFITNIVQRI